MAFPPTRSEELNTFVLAVLNDIDRNEPEDVITPRHPLFTKLKSEGAIERRPPGKGPVEDVMYKTPKRETIISLSDDMKEREFSPIEGYTQAKYDWVQILSNLTIPKVELDNAQGKNAIVDIVKRKKRQLDISFRQTQVDVLWNGLVSGAETIWGLTDAVQFDTTSNPSKGAVGRIDQTNAAATWWKNQSADYDTAFKTVSAGGYETNTMIENGTNCLMEVFRSCSDFDSTGQGNSDTAFPDLMPCNAVFERYFADLVKNRLVYQNKTRDFEFAAEGFYYRGALVFWDVNVPDSPTAGEGVCFLLNTNAFSWVYAEGLEQNWSDMMKLQKTGFAWERSTQLSMTFRNRGKLGVFYGVKAGSYGA